LLRVVAGLDKLVAEGRLDELITALRELSRRLPEFVPGSDAGGPFEELSSQLKAMLDLFTDLLEALPPGTGEIAIELLQIGISIAGLIPGAGEPFDLIGAVISGRRGEWLDVFLSAVALIPLAGIVTGIAKILKRLKKLGALAAKLKGPARAILLHFIGTLAVLLKEIPTNSIHAAIAGLKSFIVRLRKLLEETIAKLKKLKSGASTIRGARLGKAASNDYKATFFKAHPDLEGRVVVHHAVEQRVLKKYPGVVTEAEIHSLENLRGIPTDINSELHLSKIRIEWNKFYRQFDSTGTVPTQQQLLDKATEIDKLFGTRFTPGVGG
jgi:hypothetical protein